MFIHTNTRKRKELLSYAKFYLNYIYIYIYIYIYVCVCVLVCICVCVCVCVGVKLDEGSCTGSSWLRIGTGGGHL